MVDGHMPRLLCALRAQSRCGHARRRSALALPFFAARVAAARRNAQPSAQQRRAGRRLGAQGLHRGAVCAPHACAARCAGDEGLARRDGHTYKHPARHVPPRGMACAPANARAKAHEGGEARHDACVDGCPPSPLTGRLRRVLRAMALRSHWLSSLSATCTRGACAVPHSAPVAPGRKKHALSGPDFPAHAPPRPARALALCSVILSCDTCIRRCA